MKHTPSTVRVTEVTTEYRNQHGTPDEIVEGLTSKGWEVLARTPAHTVLRHPQLAGKQVYVARMVNRV